MKIKSLELFGFKSFVDRTLFEFPTGITAIVGPNGCGKSNLVDAIRWAMGEMSAKHLRGRSMEDVIFAGSETRPPVNMAEVTLNFSTEDGIAPPAYASMSEISVTRRVFREMESEYLINQVPCRLRDVHELFMDTGVGTRAYAIVEQGQIADLVNARPVDRRVLIEEAAGITKYKSKKEAALRKMDAAQQNLLRVGDIVQEVRRQMGSLDRQARRAERYKTLREELRTIELDLAARRARGLSREVQEQSAALETLRREHVSLSSAMASEEASTEALRLELAERERALNARQEQLFELKNLVAQQESQVDLLKKDRENAESRRRDGLAEQGRLGEERERIRAERDRAGREREAALEQRRALDALRAEAEGRLGDLIDREVALSEEIGRDNEALVGAIAELARVEKSVEDLARRRDEAKARAQAAAQALTEARTRQDALAEKQVAAAERAQEARHTLTCLETKRGEALRRVEILSREESEAELAWQAARDRMRETATRLDSLRELESRYEGYQEGVRAILLVRESQPSRSHSVMGLLAEVIEAPAEYERAVEAALGERLQYVVVEDVEAGIEAVEYLKRSSSGRSSFVPLSIRETRHSAGPKPDPLLAPPLLDAIKVEDRFKPIVMSLLRDVHVVDTLQRAAAIWRANGFRGTLVTKEGDLIDRLGVMTGGSARSASGGVFARKREIRELAERAEALRAECSHAEAAFGERTAARDAARSAAESIGQRLHAQDLDRLVFDEALDRIVAEKEAAERSLAALETETRGAEAMTVGASSVLDEAALRRAALATARRAGEEAMAEIQRRRAALLGDLEAARLSTTEMKITAAGLAERVQALEQETARLDQELCERDERLIRIQVEVDGAATRIKEIEEALGESEQNLALLMSQHADGRDLLAKQRDAYQLDAERLAEMDRAIRELRHRQQAKGEEINKLQVGETELRLRLQNLMDNLFDRYHVRLEDVAIDESVQIDPEALDARQAELRTQIERLGEVNVGAIEEYQELSERYRFLTEQSEDLRRTIESLQNAIQKINRTSRKLFAETFELVAAKFEETFPRLFKGGKARLLLTEGEDVLEAGVEIVAQPPGKRLQNVTLLSGGEKTLTAVSLLFAIFQVKPSPFFLLDEVDAALDDANVERFNGLLHQMTAQSQFLLITHNKATIELADTLYGVTMEIPGVSKVVSVKLQ
ncbi:MAG: chromosome segregation protein SMC [Actinobacteria bacterium RBG_13_63_9]|nr:MAG: chromosome segregation protein SMC [Actinobacteria bacterium RBG_13_63_9]